MNTRPDTKEPLWIGQGLGDIYYSKDGLKISGTVYEDGSVSMKAEYQPSQANSYTHHILRNSRTDTDQLMSEAEERICRWLASLPEWVRFTAYLMNKAVRLRSLYMTVEDWGAREWVRWIEKHDDMENLYKHHSTRDEKKDYDSKYILTYMISCGFDSPKNFNESFNASICRTINFWLNDMVTNQVTE